MPFTQYPAALAALDVSKDSSDNQVLAFNAVMSQIQVYAGLGKYEYVVNEVRAFIAFGLGSLFQDQGYVVTANGINPVLSYTISWAP